MPCHTNYLNQQKVGPIAMKCRKEGEQVSASATSNCPLLVAFTIKYSTQQCYISWRRLCLDKKKLTYLVNGSEYIRRVMKPVLWGSHQTFTTEPVVLDPRYFLCSLFLTILTTSSRESTWSKLEQTYQNGYTTHFPRCWELHGETKNWLKQK